MKSKAFFEYLLVQKPQDAWGELDYNEVKDISYAAEEWQIEKVSLDNFDWFADPDYVNQSRNFPPVAVKYENTFDVLDGKHRIGMAKTLGKSHMEMWVGKI